MYLTESKRKIKGNVKGLNGIFSVGKEGDLTVEVVIRTNASVTIGSGHVMRCLTIALKLRAAGCNVEFWMEPLSGNLINFLAGYGFKNILEPKYADLYIVDHYGLDIEWEKSIRYYTPKLVVIDDLARKHDCDLILDQNVVPTYESRYDDKVPLHCVKLLGPKYLVIRDEFIEARRQLSKRNLLVKRLLISMGGTDSTNETMKILQALDSFTFSHVDVVVGNGNPVKQQIKEFCQQRGYQFHCQINYLAQLMLQADFSIGAGGSTLWERCYVGLPSSATIVADNQISTTEFAAKLGAVKNLGWHEQVTVDTYKQLLGNLSVENMSERGLALTQNNQPNPWLHEILELIK